MKKSLYLLLLFILASWISNTQARVLAPKPTLDFGDKLSADAYLNSAAEVGPKVDDTKNGSELLKTRSLVNADSVDNCFDEDATNEMFSEQISYYASKMIEDVPAMVGTIGEYYGTSSNDSDYFPTSLIRHPLCRSTSTTLSKTMNKVPKQLTIDRLNKFADEVNGLRSAVLAGDQKAKAELLSTWTKMFSCLAYTESLSSPDSSSSQKVASRVAPTGYRRPAGVQFYDDPAQDETSRLNIGMFQFTPSARGNIQPCLRAWNAVHSAKQSCQINLKSTPSDLIKVLGSSLQSFNAFCGVHKLVETFAIQVNTSKASATHPNNIVNGKFKLEEQRCVSPHFQAGKAYNHFGPLQNSTGTNLEILFSCIDNS